MTTAQTILAQLGGGRFTTMTGAKNLVQYENALAFRFPGCKDANYCAITLDATDTYTVEFKKVTTKAIKDIATYTGVYDSQLVPLFERKTGLATRM